MNDYLTIGTAAVWAFPVGLLVAGITLGLMPGRLLRLVVRIYPKDHPHRTDLVADLYEVPYLERIFWVFGQLDTAIADGIKARRAQNSPPKSLPEIAFGLAIAEYEFQHKSTTLGGQARFSLKVPFKGRVRHFNVTVTPQESGAYIVETIHLGRAARRHQVGLHVDD